MKCPKGHDIKLAEQVAAWDRDYGDEAELSPDFPALLMIDCPECEEQIGMIEIIGVDDFEEVQTPLGESVRIPKL